MTMVKGADYGGSYANTGLLLALNLAFTTRLFIEIYSSLSILIDKLADKQGEVNELLHFVQKNTKFT